MTCRYTRKWLEERVSWTGKHFPKCHTPALLSRSFPNKSLFKGKRWNQAISLSLSDLKFTDFISSFMLCFYFLNGNDSSFTYRKKSAMWLHRCWAVVFGDSQKKTI
jgi:hypothetical protein